ncbi:MAG: exonuclease domain-containing protein, partial [Rhodoferax sp.]|nr:exonuclease domain-containing protein [Rhodoferax sp.]
MAVEKPPRSKRVVAAKAQTPEPPPAPLKTPSNNNDLEAMAQLLEAHPDYRLQRRLQPVLHWPDTCKGQRLRLLLLDTETTGLDSSKDSIIELAMLRVDIDSASGLPVGAVDVYDGLQDPGKPIPPEVVALTGIRDADVRGQQLDE